VGAALRVSTAFSQGKPPGWRAEGTQAAPNEPRLGERRSPPTSPLLNACSEAFAPAQEMEASLPLSVTNRQVAYLSDIVYKRA